MSRSFPTVALSFMTWTTFARSIITNISIHLQHNVLHYYNYIDLHCSINIAHRQQDGTFIIQLIQPVYLAHPQLSESERPDIRS